MLDKIRCLFARFTARVQNKQDVDDSQNPAWPAVYTKLDATYGLAQRGINLYLFLRDPEHYAFWITFYFRNFGLFNERVGLHFFLTHDPLHIVQVLIANPCKPLVSELLCNNTDWIGDSDAAEIQLRPMTPKPMRDVAYRGGRYIQPVNRHRINPRLKRAHG